MVNMWGRLHLAHRKFSSINANFLPPINDEISKNKEMRERLRVDWVVGGIGGTPTKTKHRELGCLGGRVLAKAYGDDGVGCALAYFAGNRI